MDVSPGLFTVRVGVAIRRLRHHRSLTLREVSDRLQAAGWGLHEVQLSRIERGQRRIDVEDITALADVLRITPLQLLRLADEAVCS